ncbi:MAG: TauD/TfdA family dioxygenase [Caulobacter sp.]|nr:TauD/TfdA family dioxygenase [Caulobacter sp.]
MTAWLEHPACWRGADMARTPDRWLYRLGDAELAELDAAIRTLKAGGKPLGDITAADFPLPVLGPALADWLERLDRGPGFLLVRGFPVGRYSKDDAALAYWIIGRHLGEPVSQNTDGDLLGQVRDTGASPADHDVRLYKTRAELSFHTDGADIIGLMCLRAGKSGGVSRICSSMAVYEAIARRRPDLLARLEQPFHHHAHGQAGPGGPPTFRQPVVNLAGGLFRMFLLVWYIRNAAEDFPDLAGLGDDERALLDLLETIPEEPGMALDMAFQPGDMQFLKNSVILHARTAYEDWDEPDQKRHLLRLWLTARQFADGDESLRRGVRAPASP